MGKLVEKLLPQGVDELSFHQMNLNQREENKFL
jgi:hypothetical protein